MHAEAWEALLGTILYSLRMCVNHFHWGREFACRPAAADDAEPPQAPRAHSGAAEPRLAPTGGSTEIRGLFGGVSYNGAALDSFLLEC